MNITRDDLAIISKFNKKDPFMGTFFATNIVDCIIDYVSVLAGDSFDVDYLKSEECLALVRKRTRTDMITNMFLEHVLNGTPIAYIDCNYIIPCFLDKLINILPICREMELANKDWYEVYKKHDCKRERYCSYSFNKENNS